MATASKADILKAAKATRYAEVAIDGVGTVRIKSLTELERSKLDGIDEATLPASLVVACQVDDAGLRVWSDEDVEAVSGLDSRVVGAMANAILRHISPTPIEDVEKN